MDLKLATPASAILCILCLSIHGTSALLPPRMAIDIMTGDHLSLRPYVKGSVSSQCQTDLQEMFTMGTENLVKVVDSIGKPAAGFVVGNFAWLGHFDECSAIEGFRYCLSTLRLKNITVPVPQVASVVSWGLCIPESCSNLDVLSSLEYLLAKVQAPFNISVVAATNVVCAEDPPAPYDGGFIVTVLLLGLIGLLMIMGALLDKTLKSVDYKPTATSQKVVVNHRAGTSGTNVHQRATDSGAEFSPGSDADLGVPEQVEQKEVPTECARAWHQFLLSFAVNLNLSKLMNAKTSDSSISCLNGIRVISMSWVILGHTTSFVLGTSIVGNPQTVVNAVFSFGFQAIDNAFFSVDSFFFLSGLLVAYLTLGRMAKTNGHIPWLWFYVHRYWRLTPALIMTMLIQMYIKPHLGSGPIWQVQAQDVYCPKYWWTNILYINNIVGPDGCIGWVWYLANDMQFFIISPFLLILLYRKPILGFLCLAALSAVSVIVTGIIMAVYRYEAVLMDELNPHLNMQHPFQTTIYDKPYCRIAPYLVGMAMGYFLEKFRNRDLKLHPILVVVGWMAATAMGLALVYGLYGYFHNHPATVSGSAAYMALCRLGWSACLCWVVFACRFGYAGWVNDFLSWELWIPMSRVTYGAYLLHPIIISAFQFNYRNTYYISMYTLAFEFTGIFVMAYCGAVLMGLFIEFPMANLEKMIIPSGQKKAN
ncbi:nose resistant to fluoxetine protein 6-like [Diadema antillarum]|uniref:nose resistant to fluoxetine protein 6-like n=1 Tax=Diadema antillarum TaxID=105358 RepID=UPI003A8611A9